MHAKWQVKMYHEASSFPVVDTQVEAPNWREALTLAGKLWEETVRHPVAECNQLEVTAVVEN